MSRNLHCKELKDLVQTPTWITEMILSENIKGGQDGGWRGVANRYILWLQYLCQNEFNAACADPREQARCGLFYSEMISQVRSAVREAERAGTEMHFDGW